MIRAHLATFPPRAAVLERTLASILPQVDRLFLCLNQHDAVPAAIAADDRITAIIPDRDLKDAGKFAFVPDDDDIVFTIDDDILYPPDYVARTVAAFDLLPGEDHVLGYLGNAWMAKGREGLTGWKTFMYHKRAPHVVKVDVLGTGTACMRGRHLPRLDEIADAAGFVDLRHARLHTQAGRRMWSLPRAEDWMQSLMTEDLKATALFTTVALARDAAMTQEMHRMLAERGPHSGLQLAQLRNRGLL